MTGGDHSSNNTPVNQEQNQHHTPLQNPEHSIPNGANTHSINDNKYNLNATGNNNQGFHPPGNGNPNEFGLSPQNYFDSNWASSLLMDPNSDILYNMDFDSQENLAAAHPMIYQSNAAPQNPNINVKLGLATSQPTINGPSQEHQLPQVPHPPSSFTPKSQQAYIQAQQNIPPQQTKSTKQRRPCDHCRRRKTKCVIIPNTNNCAQCESKSLTCTYVGLALKRKTGYDSDSDSKRAKSANVKTSENRLGSDNTNNPGMGRLPNDHSKIVAPNVPIRDVAPVRDYSSINNSLLQKTLSLQFPRSSFYVGPTSYLYDTNLLNLIIDSQNKANNSNKNNVASNGSGKIEQVNLSNSTSLRKVSDHAQFILKDDQSPRSYQNMSNDVDTVEKFVAPHGQILIDLYFRIIHPSYPILHKKVFLEKYSRTHREFSAPLLAAVYALAIQWWDYDPQLNKFPKPDVDLILKVGLNNYLLEILKRPKLSAVQAGLLLLQCKHIIQSNSERDTQAMSNSANTNTSTLTSDSHYSDWVLCSQVITLAEELGLGLNCNDWKLPKWERGLRKRLAWAVYMEDKWLSLKNSRPSHINELNWVVVSLVDEDFPEKHGDGDLKEGSSDIENGKKIFMNLINLTMILSDILDKLYSMKAMSEINDIAQVLQIAKPLQLKLRNWYHSLPIDLQMSSVQPRKLCSNGYLQLAYFATELTLHRKIITTIFLQSLAGNLPPKELIEVCRTAAKTRLSASIEFVRDLKPEHMHSFWHSSSSSNFTLICTFAAILYMTSSSKEESDFYKDQIFNYRWILKISSKGFDRICDVLQELDTVLNHIPGLLNDNSDFPVIPPNESASGYNHLQKQQDIPLNTSHFSFRDTSLYLNFNRPGSTMYNNQDVDNNNSNNENSRMKNSSHIQYINRQGDDYDSPYDSHLNHSSTPYSSQGQHHLQTGNQISSVLHHTQDLSPKTMIKQQLPFGTNFTENEPKRAISGNSPDNHTRTGMNSNVDNKHMTNTPNTQNISPTNHNGIISDLKSDTDERR